MIKRNLDNQVLIIEDAQTEIHIAVQSGYFAGKSKVVIEKQVRQIITKALKGLSSKILRQDTQKSLTAYANRIYRRLISSLGFNGAAAFYALKVAQGEKFSKSKQLPVNYPTDEKGVPLQEYQKEYIAKVKRVVRDISKFNAVDPNDISGSKGLRNLAEMQIRYEYQQNQIAEMRMAGVKLVVASVHADCSDRCFPHQGKVYSLDGSSGKTEDGRAFIPLENATDIYYTTKAGRTYKNGLFGFNCRHYIYKYQPGMAIPYVDKATQEKESKINTKQRELERRVIGYKERALAFKDIDREEYLKARRRAIAANKAYKQFSHAHERPYYPDRVKILI